MSTRIYTVTDSSVADCAPQLVEASTKSQAIAAVVRHRYAARVSSQHELVELLDKGVKVIDASAEASQE
ncbi:hypothetical protein [Lysobacter sp. ESA13C]|uniref:hypothetical protein n=1 Tax=Lysobacter sp. ESA13C TaxID=2862676 RepID=UPI001CC11D35|nr:hypothetical protein [Lysobacter sp. ESA13C]